MKRLSFIIIALLAWLNNNYAEDKLQVEDLLISPGGTATLNIVLSNPDAQYTAVQADLYLPEGVDLVTENDDYKYTLSRVSDSHTLSIGKMNGYYRLVLSSTKNNVLSGNSGKVISLSIKANDGLTIGTLNGSLKNNKLAQRDGTGLIKDEVVINVIVSDTPDTPDIPTIAALIKISAAKQVAYCSDQDMDFTDKPELKAYVATGYDKTTGTIWLTRVKDVPANTGFLLMGEAGEYEVPVKDGSNSYYMNMFKGTIEATTIQTTETIDGKEYTNYYLSNGDQGVGFYKVTKAEGQSLPANRAYLSVPSGIPAVGTAGSTEAIKVSAAGQVPYYSANSLDFTTMENVKAYTATGYDYKSGTIWLTRVKKVPAETGILIMAPEGSYPIPTASVATVYGNMFKGTLEGKTIQTTETVAGVDYINYYLSSGKSGVGFYKVTKEGGVELKPNRCYLPIPQQSAGTRGIDNDPNSFSIQESDDVIGLRVFGSADGTTGIETNNREPIINNLWYNIQGQRVENPGKGLYIRNGKKVVIK